MKVLYKIQGLLLEFDDDGVEISMPRKIMSTTYLDVNDVTELIMCIANNMINAYKKELDEIKQKINRCYKDLENVKNQSLYTHISEIIKSLENEYKIKEQILNILEQVKNMNK
ncbi:MAG: hypothetical protein QXZ22_08615 [Sulfolobales archaeon]